MSILDSTLPMAWILVARCAEKGTLAVQGQNAERSGLIAAGIEWGLITVARVHPQLRVKVAIPAVGTSPHHVASAAGQTAEHGMPSKPC